jgi:Leucine-rich repeat (LRR) protein
LKKLIVILGIVFLYSTLFAAAAEDSTIEKKPSQLVSHTPIESHPLTGLPEEIIHHIFSFLTVQDYEILPRALTLDMRMAKDDQIPHMIELLKSRNNIRQLRITNINPSILESILTGLLGQNVRFSLLRELDISTDRHKTIIHVLNPLLEKIWTLVPNLTSLVYNDKISDLRPVSLDHLSRLSSLNISFNNIGDLGVVSLAQMHQLRKLDASHNQISDKSKIFLWKNLSFAHLTL